MTQREIFPEQLGRHPSMDPQDLMKMCFQAAFGVEHIIADAAAAEKCLREEWETVSVTGEPLYEEISEETVRVNLGAWKREELPLAWLLIMFLESAAHPPKDKRRRFDEMIGLATEFLQEEMPECASEKAKDGTEEAGGCLLRRWREYLSEYPLENPHAVHHSEAYRAAEKPAYRLVCRRFVRLFPVLKAIAALRKEAPEDVLVVSVDGRSASGKTTLAQQLSTVTGAGVIHTDDFFLPMELRTKERLEEPGGNVHYERFAREVLPHLARSGAFSYRIFDCGRRCLTGERLIPEGKLRIVEGAYSSHPFFADYADLRVFSDVESDEQERRILLRNGEEMLKMFRQKWIPLEERYFKVCRIREKAEIFL